MYTILPVAGIPVGPCLFKYLFRGVPLF
jgi:hypothetical protein